ncbi:uncharacterized protein LOC142657510 [Rhinoderma darwinii]|uniref:uncharacterized protein LOC142657510 n=1 Tax=Rhinoderma darwinii TaxID=43563 RepID=UPI003F676DD8
MDASAGRSPQGRTVGQVSSAGAGGGVSWPAVSRASVEGGVTMAMSLVERSVSAVTWQRYSAVWQVWEALLDNAQAGIADRQACLLYFIGNAYSEGSSAAMVARSLSALAFWFKKKGEEDVTKSFLVRQAMKGFRRGSAVRDLRKPVSFELLVAICDLLREVCVSAFEVRLFTLAFSLAFFGAFRISELVSASKSVAGGLLYADVDWDGSCLSCLLRRSKTDQEGRGFVVRLYELPGSRVCPVRCFREFIAVRPEGPASLLVHADGLSLSKFQFSQVFKKFILLSGRGGAGFSSHSFRIGAATEAARWGLSPVMVKKIGRWESDRYRLYVRPHLL